MMFFIYHKSCSPNDPVMNYTTEGCYCPEGMKLFSKESNICVKSCGKYVRTILNICFIIKIQHLWFLSFAPLAVFEFNKSLHSEAVSQMFKFLHSKYFGDITNTASIVIRVMKLGLFLNEPVFYLKLDNAAKKSENG